MLSALLSGELLSDDKEYKSMSDVLWLNAGYVGVCQSAFGYRCDKPSNAVVKFVVGLPEAQAQHISRLAITSSDVLDFWCKLLNIPLGYLLDRPLHLDKVFCKGSPNFYGLCGLLFSV